MEINLNDSNCKGVLPGYIEKRKEHKCMMTGYTTFAFSICYFISFPFKINCMSFISCMGLPTLPFVELNFAIYLLLTIIWCYSDVFFLKMWSLSIYHIGETATRKMTLKSYAIFQGDVIVSFNDVSIASEGTVPFRSTERIAFRYLISQK